MREKTITICGSMKVVDKMIAIGEQLEKKGYKILLPSLEEKSDYTALPVAKQAVIKHPLIVEHLNKIRASDAILVVNERVKGIDGYIGANSFLEMGFALCLEKKIFLLNDIPDQPNVSEISGLLPVVLHGDIHSLNI
jgi:hypothetical protein